MKRNGKKVNSEGEFPNNEVYKKVKGKFKTCPRCKALLKTLSDGMHYCPACGWLEIPLN